MNEIKRLPYLDRVRTLCILGLFPFHVADYYSDSRFALKTGVIIPWLNYLYHFFYQWRLALLFMIAGISAVRAIEKYGESQFFKEKLKRIFVPLILGSILLVTPQVYIERLQEGSFQGNFWEFLPDSMKGTYPEGNRSWGHLWFLFYLFFYSVVYCGFASRISKLTPKFYWWSFPILVEIFLRPYFPSFPNFVTDLANLLVFGFYFFMGTLFFKSSFSAIEKHQNLFLGFAILLLIISPLIESNLILALRTLCMVLVGVTMTRGWNQAPGKLLNYFKNANYSLYVIHHTVIIILAYFLVHSLSPTIFFLVVTGLSFLISLLLYEAYRQCKVRLK